MHLILHCLQRCERSKESLRRHLIVGRKYELTILAVPVLALCGCGISYDCVAKCEETSAVTARIGYNAETDARGGLDPDSVCTKDSIEEATSCGECFRAMVDEYRHPPPSIGCECHEETDYPENAGGEFAYMGANCREEVAIFGEEGCDGWREQRHPAPQACLDAERL